MQMIFKSAFPCLLFLPLFVARKGFISFVVWRWIKPAQFIIAFYPHFKHHLQLLRSSNFSLNRQHYHCFLKILLIQLITLMKYGAIHLKSYLAHNIHINTIFITHVIFTSSTPSSRTRIVFE